MKVTLPDDREDFEAKELPRYRPSSTQDSGRFDEETYARARAFVDQAEEAPKTKSSKPAASKPSAPKTESAKKTPAPAPSSAPEPTPAVSKEPDQESGRVRLSKIFGTQEAREKAGPDIKGADVEAAKKAGEERRRRDRESFLDPFKRLAARIGSQEMREKYKAEGYAKGGSVSSASRRADGCAMRGKTKGRIV